MIEAQLPDGTTLQFPDGTDTAVVQRVVRQQLGLGGAASPQQQASPAQAAESPMPTSAAPVAPGPPAAAPEYGIDQPAGDQGGTGSTTYGGADPVAPLRRAGAAAVEGYQSVPSTQPVQDVVSRYGGITAPLINPLIAGAGGALALGAGAYRGAQQLGYDVINPLLGPQAARDIVSIPDAFAGSPGAASVPRRPPIPQPPAPTPRFIGEYPGGGVALPGTTSLDRITGAVRRADDTAPSRQGLPPDVPPGPAGVGPEPAGAPRSAGAAASPASELGLTPGEEQAYRATAEGNRLLERQEPGVRDERQYLKGERINEAEASQDVVTARELKSLRQQTPELDARMAADEEHNNNLRAQSIERTLPGQVQINAAKAERERAIQTAEPEVFRNATDADVQPIVAEIQAILDEPKNRQNSQLRQYVRPLIDRLQNADGTPKIVDPLELWGWRQDIQHLTSQTAQRGDPNLARVSGNLGRVLEVTDAQLEAAAPGYQARLRDDYRQRSREIDAMEALDAQRFKLFDSQNVPNYNAVQGMLRRITDARIGGDPYEPFTHVPQATLDALFDIRNSMRRARAADRLAQTKGSDTSQNIGDAIRTAAKLALPALGAGIGHKLVPIPFAGEAAGLIAGQAVNHLFSRGAMRRRLERGIELTTPRNSLMP